MIFGEGKFAFEKRVSFFQTSHESFRNIPEKHSIIFRKTALEFEEILEENMKKFLYIIAAVLAFTSLYGCGNNSSSETEKAKETVDSFFAALKDADFKTAAD